MHTNYDFRYIMIRMLNINVSSLYARQKNSPVHHIHQPFTGLDTQVNYFYYKGRRLYSTTIFVFPYNIKLSKTSLLNFT